MENDGFTQATTFVRLLLAALLSGLIGWERERLRKPAGFRTHILVGLGSCLIMLVSLELARLYPAYAGVDPGRIAANVVVGIGFLGAGTILHSRDGWVSGLTTAASLWVVAGIGLAAGLGYYSAAVGATLLVLVVLFLLNTIDDYIERNLYHTIWVHGALTMEKVEKIKTELTGAGLRILKTDFQNGAGTGRFVGFHCKPFSKSKGQEVTKKLRTFAKEVLCE